MAPTVVSTLLSSLNPAQLKGKLVYFEILAGPGSGKTKVLTSRVAHLILHHAIPPSSICAVTFTNKAANEMRERLVRLIGEQRTSQIKLGTFHALCAFFLRKYANVISLERNFTVCDAEESKKIIAGLLKPFKDELEAGDINLKESTVSSMISRAKARGLDAAAMTAECNASRSMVPSTSDQINAVVSSVYTSYESALRQTNSLDFDDLLLFGVKLFRSHRKAVEWCKHVLVDEFQDTNITQYELMHQLAVHKSITVVGDPDQSIYGWRSAEVGNLARMRKDCPNTQDIFLEENYRSTGSILDASLAIVAQDQNRIRKTLFTSHPMGSTPVLRRSASEHAEAASIAAEVKQVVAYTGGLLGYGDFAILLRFTALSRALEGAFQKEGIPTRVLGGHKFFERLEIRDLLAYLQLIDNPEYDPAFLRAVNVPARGIGEKVDHLCSSDKFTPADALKTLDNLASRAQGNKSSMLKVVERICDNRIPDIKPPIKRKLADFVKAMQKLRKLASEGKSPPDLLRELLRCIDYQQHLKKTQSDWDTRWENVEELITFASEVRTDEIQDDDGTRERQTPLRLFLQASMLSSEGDNQNEASNKDKVTIATCHAAKGLEWPVVFIPAVEAGTFPFYRTEDMEEERRLLYVACTRAQCLLYLSHAEKRMVAGETKNKALSPFLTTVKQENELLFTDIIPELKFLECRAMSRMLGRSEPSEKEVQSLVAQFEEKYGSRVRHDVTRHNGVTSSQEEPLGDLSHFTAGFVSSSKAMNHAQFAAQAPTPMTHLTPTNQSASPRYTVLDPISNTPAQNPPYQPTKKLPLQTVPPPFRESTEASVDKNQIAVVDNRREGNNPLTVVTAGVKRRLGMGRSVLSYTNKKFKPPS
ncbi:hypothetical protein D9756_003438 [Leucocoprinus leucothites]|uniref:DNA 3'-5' helicase n=1 Tax=Leucocoprinus leucothites TaxID=201217 RepID=A0A8H5G682_9AGAR|nr:hypothetical protein D9756_003438 [Leucoagaricus leucothites]